MTFPSKYKNNANASTGLLFIRVYNAWHTAIKQALKTLSITHPQFVLMTTLHYLSQFEEYVAQAKIARMADMDVMTVSQIIRGLENKGFLQRSPHPTDTRSNAVYLLPKGQQAVRQALPIVEKIDEVFFGVLKDKENTLQELLLTLQQQNQ